MVFQQSVDDRPRRADGELLPAVPEWWTLQRGGSNLEYYIWQAILRTGRVENLDFVFQSRLFGGRINTGGAVADFLIFSPRVGINVQSLYYHGTTAQQRAHDELQRIAIEGDGLRLEYIQEDDAINRPDQAVREAIAGIGNRGPIGD